MIEDTILDYLNSKLKVKCYLEVPGQMPKQFVIVEKLGGSESDCVKYASFAIQSYAETIYKAAVLNEVVKEAMDNLIELDDITSSELDSDYNYTDTNIKRNRYQAVYDIYYL